MKIEDECNLVLRKHLGTFYLDWGLSYRNRLVSDLTKLIEKKESFAREEGYEAGRWDRPTNKSGGI